MIKLNRKNSLPFLSLILMLLSIILYFVVVAVYSQYDKEVVPSGDPFSYTISLFQLLDRSNADYLDGIFNGVFNSQWYWLYKLPVAILAPFLAKEPYILCFVNFLFMAIGTVSFSRLVLRLGFNFNTTLVLTLFLWLYPWIYGHFTSFGLFVLMLETSFYWILISFTAHLIIYCLEPKSYKNALIAGIFGGLAIWGRGNSLPYVLIVLWVPVTLILYRWTKDRALTKKSIASLAVFMGSLGILALWFYSVTFEELQAYYWDWDQFGTCEKNPWLYLTAHPDISLAGVKFILINFPGVVIFKNPFAFWSIFFTALMHVLVAGSLGMAIHRWKKEPGGKNRLLAVTSLTGATLFYGNLVLMLFLISPSFGVLQNIEIDRNIFFNPSLRNVIYHPFLMMFVGFSFAMLNPLSLLSEGKAFNKWIDRPIVVPLVMIFVLSYGYFFSKIMMPERLSYETANPDEVNKFALNLEKIIGGHTLSVLWYGQAYNRFILNYYRFKNGLPAANFYASHAEIGLFITSYYDDCGEKIPIEDFRKRLQKIMKGSDYIIIPEDISKFDYMMARPGLAHRRGELAKILNSPNGPKYGVKMILHDYFGTRLLLLQRLKFGKNPGHLDLLQLPYGEKNPSPAFAYSRPDWDTFQEIIPVNLFGARNLSSSSSDKFWETSGSYPHKMQAEMTEPRRIAAYAFKVGIYVPESITRMPTDWKLEGSLDGSQWIALDSRTGQTQWKKDAEENFPVQNPGKYALYRFVFQKGGDKKIIRINEIKFLEEDRDGTTRVIDPLEYEWEE